MAEITTYLCPNGQTATEGRGPATCLRVATIQGVVTLKRAGPGASWARVGSSLTDRHIGSLLFEPVSGKLFAGAHENGGLWVSDDGEGNSWRQVTKGLSRPHIYALAQRNVGGKVMLLAGTQPSGVYRSDDFGESWAELPAIFSVPDTDKWTFPGPPHLPHVKCFTIHPTQPQTFYVLIEQGALLKTTDDGKTFVEISSYSTPGELAYRDLHRLLINPDRTQEMFLATGEGFYRSEDGGGSWTHLMKRGERVGYPDDLFFDPSDRRVLFMAGAAKSPNEWMRTNQAEPVVLKSRDRGDSWVEIHNGLPQVIGVAFEAMSQHVWPGGYMLVIASAAGQVWTSEDGGAAWEAVPEKLPPISKDHHYLPFLPQDERKKWMERRMARTAGTPPGRPPAPRA